MAWCLVTECCGLWTGQCSLSQPLKNAQSPGLGVCSSGLLLPSPLPKKVQRGWVSPKGWAPKIVKELPTPQLRQERSDPHVPLQMVPHSPSSPRPREWAFPRMGQCAPGRELVTERRWAPSPPVSGYQRSLCLSERRRKLKPLMKRPSVLLQERPPEGNGQWSSGLW